MKIVTTGSRHWANEQQIIDVLDELLQGQPNKFLDVGHGKSRGGGADLFVANWCWDNRNRVDEWPFPVVRGLDGSHRGAPLNRNKRMVSTFFPDLVIAFRSEGKSNGTDFTIDYAEKLGIPTEVHNET